MSQTEYEIKVDCREALRYMGVTASPDEAALAEVRRIAQIVTESARPRVTFKELTISRKDERVGFHGSALTLQGRAVSALLRDSEACVLFCATIGNEIEALLRKWQLKDMAAAAMLDACASDAVESLCDAVEEKLRAEYMARGLYLTDRFSPGYADLPIEVQKEFCAELDTARRVGVSVSADGIMIPRKSVTALMGVSAQPQKSRKKGCTDCLLINNCKFRESKVTCYGQAL